VSDACCPYCGEEVGARAERCSACGELLAAPSAPAERARRPLLVVLVVLGVGLGGCLLVASVAAVIIPSFITGGYMGNESQALGSLKSIWAAEELLLEGDRDGDGVPDYGELFELGELELIDVDLASGTRRGYLFEALPSSRAPGEAWMGTARPQEPGVSGARYFAVTQDGALYYSVSAPIPLDPETCAVPADRLASGDIVRLHR